MSRQIPSCSMSIGCLCVVGAQPRCGDHLDTAAPQISGGDKVLQAQVTLCRLRSQCEALVRIQQVDEAGGIKYAALAINL